MPVRKLPDDPWALPGVFVAIIAWLVAFPFLARYWAHDDKTPPLDPHPASILAWTSEAEFRRLAQERGPTFEWLLPYDTSTPDGRWHVMVRREGPVPSSVKPYALGLVLPPLVLSIIGLGICYKGRAGTPARDGLASPVET